MIKDFIGKYSAIRLQNKLGKDLLIEFLSQWEKSKMIIYWMKKLFMYLDTYYAKNIFTESREGTPSLESCGLQIFIKYIFENFCGPVVEQIFKEIETEREGKLADWDLIHKIIKCYIYASVKNANLVNEGNELVWKGEEDTKYYDTLFEPKYIEYTTNYYRTEASRWFSIQSTPEYTKTALAAFQHEKEKIEKFLNRATYSKLEAKMVKVIIEGYDKKLVEKQESGCEEMLKNKKLSLLKDLYLLFFMNKSSFKYIFEILKKYLKEKALTILNNPDLEKKPVKFIEEFINLKNEMDDILITSFNKDSDFSKVIDFQFCDLIKDYLNFPNFLAIYSDELLRVGLKGKTEQQEDFIIKIMYFVTCIVQKDCFIFQYSKLLAYRLLNGSSISNEAEASLISKLNVECGFNNIAKLQNMVEDITLSSSIQDEFKSNKSEIPNEKAIELKIKVLGFANWP